MRSWLRAWCVLQSGRKVERVCGADANGTRMQSQEETRRAVTGGLLAGSGRSDRAGGAAHYRWAAPCVTASQIPSSAARCRRMGGADDGARGNGGVNGGPLGAARVQFHSSMSTSLPIDPPLPPRYLTSFSVSVYELNINPASGPIRKASNIVRTDQMAARAPLRLDTRPSRLHIGCQGRDPDFQSMCCGCRCPKVGSFGRQPRKRR